VRRTHRTPLRKQPTQRGRTPRHTVTLIDGNAPGVTRGVIATLQDLGYRITKAEPGAGTVTATKLNTISITAVVRQHGAGQSIVRANATVLSWESRRRWTLPNSTSATSSLRYLP
jgi:hypothetical protein